MTGGTPVSENLYMTIPSAITGAEQRLLRRQHPPGRHGLLQRLAGERVLPGGARVAVSSPFNSLMLAPLHFMSFILKNIFQFIHFESFVSINFNSFASINALQFLQFNSFMSIYYDNSCVSNHAFQVLHVKSFMSIDSCQFVLSTHVFPTLYEFL